MKRIALASIVILGLFPLAAQALPVTLAPAGISADHIVVVKMDKKKGKKPMKMKNMKNMKNMNMPMNGKNMNMPMKSM